MPLRDQAMIRGAGAQASLLVLLAAACLAGGGCARMLEAMFAPQQAAAGTVGQVANSTGATAAADSASQSANATVGEFGDSVDRLLSGRPENAAELERIKAEVARRVAAARNAAGCAQDDPTRRVPWHPRTPEMWPPGDAFGVAGAMPVADRGTWERWAPLPDGVPPADPPLGLDLSPIRVGSFGAVPTLPDKLPR